MASSEGFSLSEVPVRTPRKRRRPALSCVQCRHRKVKCDRKLPCTQCSQYNSATSAACKYDDPEVAAKGKLSNFALQNLRDTSSIPPSNSSHGLSGSNDTIPFNSLSTPVLPGFENRSLSSSVPWGPPPPAAEYTRSEQHASESSVGARTPQTEASIQELKERVQKLEDIISSSNNYSSRPIETGPSLSITNVPKLRGNINKTRFFGMSHWMNTYDEFDQLRSLKNDDKFDNGSELQKLLKKCKYMARVVKAERPISSYTLPDFNSHIPSREIADQLVQLYFDTFESTYRILHRGLFFKEYEQYWKDPAAGSTSFVVKLLLVLAIGTVFYDDGTNGTALRSLAPQWIYAAQTWLSGPFEKARLNLAGIEAQCLFTLARQTHNLESDLLWINVGTLFRTAMSMGLHRDPSHFPKISVFHAELRRRLWATITELATQSSLDCGMPPMFSFNDFDCEPPANYNDADIDEQTKTYPSRNQDTVYTDSSIQITLLQSLRTRLEISFLINDFRSIPPYEKVLALSSDLTSHIRSHSTLYTSSQAPQTAFTTPHRNLLDLFTRRFLLALHHPFAIQAKTDHRFYFSRKMSLDAALAILAHPYPTNDPSSSPAPSTSENQHLPLMLLLTGGFFQEILSRASTAVALELINQIKEDSSPASESGRVARRPLHDALDQLVRVERRRVEIGSETNVKGYLFLCMVQSQAAAMERGKDIREAIAERAKVAAEEAYGLLRRLVTHAPVDGQRPDERARQVMAESNVDWDLLMQDTMIDFDGMNNWLFDSWEDAHNLV